jgi:NADH dehydrogenase FAD-containing subunit
VGGAGSTGIEVAGELGYEYGKTKAITLLSAGDKVLSGDSVAPAAANELKKLNVTIKYGARVQGAKTLPDGKTEVTLANGEVLTTDLYLATTGLVPNTEYIPAQYLSADVNYRTVLVDEYLRVQEAKDVWACGDVVSKPRAGFFITQKQAASVAKNVEAALAGREPTVAKGPPVDIFACAVGRGRGAGRMGSIKLPSFGVWLAKGRTLGVQMVPGYVDGSVA